MIPSVCSSIFKFEDIEFVKVLFFRKDNQIQLGKPFLGESQIPAKIIQQVKGQKIIVLKKYNPKGKTTKI